MTRKRKTPAKTVNDQAVVIELRRQIRVVLSAAAVTGRNLPRVVIQAKIEAQGFGFTDGELDEAIEWNHSRNLIDYSHNYDLSVDEWFLTEKGAARE